MLDKLNRYIQNLPGKVTKRKLVVIESDDWGSIRMPNIATYNQLRKEGFELEKDPYLKFDALASESDLNALFETLGSVRDFKGNSAKITANCVVANPDFPKIKTNGYSEYYWEAFTTTLARYPYHSKSFELWREGINSNLFKPQYHGREHINTFQWMKALKNGDNSIAKAFDLEMISLNSSNTDMRYDYMEGLDFFSEKERREKAAILEEGMNVFKTIFGYASLSFVANCYIWDDTAERSLSKMGIKYIQGISNQILPKINNKGEHTHKYIKHYFGQKNKFGQRYFIRNAFFEPSFATEKDWVSDCLQRIEIAFKCKKPAIICSHRLNYIGYIYEPNRTENLKQLKLLLKRIIKKWPNVEFISTDELDALFKS